MKPKAKKRQFRRCQWMMASKGWRDCGRKATRIATKIMMTYCTEHASKVIGYDMRPL